MRADAAVEALSALAHPNRLAIFRLLVQAGDAGLAAGEIARRTDTLANTLSANLATLAHAGLVEGRRDGRSIIYTAAYGQMRDLLGFLVEDCCQGRPQICGDLAETGGVGFYPAVIAGCALTVGPYLAMTWLGSRFGLRL